MSVREIKKKLKKEISRIFQIMSELKNLKSGGIIFFLCSCFFIFFIFQMLDFIIVVICSKS